MEALFFYTFSAISILSAFVVILHRKPTRALLALIVTMFSLAILFILLGAYFIAMIHIIVYAGAVLVLFLFVIMLQGIGAKDVPLFDRFRNIHYVVVSLVCVTFTGFLIYIVSNHAFPASQQTNGTVENIGITLFSRYLLPFELTSVVLLLGIFAAVALAKKEKERIE